MTLYRLLLRLFPRAFRERFGDDMAQVFADRLQTARRHGGMATTVFFSRTIADTLSHGLAERLSGHARSRKGDGFMSSLARDIRYAIRSLRLAPGFTVVALVVLTLGIGATTAIFSVVDAVVLRPLPFEDAQRLIDVTEVSVSELGHRGAVAPQNYFDWKARQGGVFEDLAAAAGGAITLRDRPEPEILQVSAVSASLFPMLRAQPERGRLFTAENETEGNNHVLLISDSLWRRRFGGDPRVVGSTIRTAQGTWLIAGVMPPGFTYPIGLLKPIEAWAPFVAAAEEHTRTTHSRSSYLKVVGRLAAGVTLEQARAKMNQVTVDLAREYPDWFEDRGIALAPLQDALVGDVRAPMVTLLVAVALVLLIACVNVANLVLARSAMRRREVAIRAAIGASRWTVMRGVLVENLLLSLTGTALGLLAAWWGVHAIMALLPTNLPRVSTVGINARVLAVAGFAAIATGLLFGLIPSWQLSRQDLAAVLGQISTGARRAVAGRRLRTLFIVSEIAIAVVLVVGATLFLASYIRVMRVDTGMDYRQIMAVPLSAKMDLSVKEHRDAEIARGAAVIRDVRQRIEQIAGVEATALYGNGAATWEGGGASTSLWVPGVERLRPPFDQAQYKTVSDAYFKTMGILVVRGREFTAADTVPGSNALILSDAAATHFFGGLDVIGRTVNVNGNCTCTVVGVVRGVRLGGPEADVRPEAYRPINAEAAAYGTLYVRVAPHMARSADTMKRVIDDMHLAVRVTNPHDLATLFDKLVRPRTLNTVLVALFGVLALVIAAVGIYGVMAYVVAQRTGEIGIRMALGARPAQIKMDVVSEAARVIGVGVVIGAAGAWMLTRLIGTLLFEVKPHDLWLYAAAIAIFMGVGLIAAFIPARRAAMVDPICALKQ